MKYPQVTMLFSAYDPFRDACRSTEEMTVNGMSIGGWPDGPLHQVTLDDGVVMKVGVPNGAIKAIGMNSPLPHLERYFYSSRSPREDLASLCAHRFHLSCWYEFYRGDGVAATRDMFHLAQVFAPFGLLGVLHGSGRQCFNGDSLTTILQELQHRSWEHCHKRLINVCTMQIHDVTYYVSRGARELGGRNVALMDGTHRSAAFMDALLYRLLNQVRRGLAPEVGTRHTVDGVELETLPVVDYSEYVKADPTDDVLLLRVCF